MNVSRFWGLALSLLMTASTAAQPAEHEGEEHEEEGAIVMAVAERTAQGIRTAQVSPRVLTDVITAPGEVRLNDYQTAQVTPRIAAQIVARHARLGEPVKAGQALVTLSSVEVAAAQGALIEADREWNRVRELGRGVVSETRYIAAEVARQRAYATVRAYGLTKSQVSKLLADGDASRATGEFALLSPRAGTVIRDPFVVGEIIEPGQVLFVVSDESVLWVEAQMRPDRAGDVTVGASARVSRDGTRWLEGTVLQLHHGAAAAPAQRGDADSGRTDRGAKPGPRLARRRLRGCQPGDGRRTGAGRGARGGGAADAGRADGVQGRGRGAASAAGANRRNAGRLDRDYRWPCSRRRDRHRGCLLVEVTRPQVADGRRPRTLGARRHVEFSR